MKGNITLLSFDGRYKIQVSVADFLDFDERLNVAKSLIDECLMEWKSEGINVHLGALIEGTFQINAQGRYDRSKILGLRKYDIDYPKWQTAMQAIADSETIRMTKSYTRFFERDDKGKYQSILLDLAKV